MAEADVATRRAPSKKKSSPSKTTTLKNENSDYSSVLAELKLIRQEIKDMSTAHGVKLADLEKTISQRDSEILELRATVLYLQEQFQRQEQAVLCNQIEIAGLPESVNESLPHIIQLAANKIGVILDESEVDWVSRVGPPKQSNSKHSNLPRPVVVKLLRRTKRNEILKAAKIRKNVTTEDIVAGTSQRLYFNERLSKHNRDLFREARARALFHKFQFCWVNNGSIFVRKEVGKPGIPILSCNDLDKQVGPKIPVFSVAATTGSSQRTCDIYIDDACDGVITCKTFPGRVDYLPDCGRSSYNLEFIVKYSTQTSLETHFFGDTNFDGKVTKFTGLGNSWTRIGKSAFKYYVNCLNMDLSNNNIVAFQGGALAQLGKLTHLNLSHNNIKNLESDFLEVSADYYSNIQVVDLSHNNLVDLRSSAFKEAPKLTFLSLSNNMLISLDQNIFSGVLDLTELYLNNNMLSSLTFQPDDVKSLSTLDVSNNVLSVVLKGEINKLLSLKNLNMSHNIIESVETYSFGHSHYLEVIDLSNNKIKTDVETIQFSGNHELKFLDLTNNSIKIIQGRAFLKNRLQDLHLEGNILSGFIEGDTFAGLNLIRTLDLSSQNFTGIRANSFQDMSNLETITFKANQIESIEPNSFKNANALQLLDLSFNRISDLIFLNNSLSNLTQLDLNHNRLAVIKSESFLSQTLLIKLDLSQNEIYIIEQNALPLKRLEYLFLSGNKLKGTVDKFTFSPAKFLRRLDLSNFSIKRIEDESFSDMPVLTSLDISVNQIDFLGSNNFNGMNNMYSLNISHNRLSQLVLNDSNTYNINGLYLQHNNLHSLNFHNLSKLTFLDVSQNKISDLSIKMFNSLPQIQVLLLSHNNISQFNSNETNMLANLTKLDLSNNRICSINLTYFEKLEDINLSYNLLKNISHSNILQNLGKVLLLDISNNKISNIAPGTFKDVGSLRTLNLSTNLLTALRYGVFHGLSNVDILDISKNNLSDLEVDIFHELPKLHTLILDYNNLSHIDVVRLGNVAPQLQTISLGGNRLPCKDIVSFKYIDQILMRPIVITSIDNIHHEENVSGLKCKGGADMKSEIEVKSKDNVDNSAGIGTIMIWCLVLTILFASLCLGGGFYLYKKSGNNYATNNEIYLNVQQQQDLLS